MSKLDYITGGIGELDFFDKTRCVLVFQLDNITGRIGKLDFFDKIEFVFVF
jgi:hypothetical protein